MTLFHLLAPAVFTLSAASAFAAAPALQVSESTTINAPASEVWKHVKDFDGLHKWHPAVGKADIVSGKNNQPGAVRLLTLKDGGTIREELQKMNESGKTYQYRIIEGVLPVSSYVSTVTVEEAGKKQSRVTWSGNFKRKNTGDNPGEKENDAAATNTMTAVYKAGLENLKKMAESGAK